MRVYLITQQTEQSTWLHKALKKVERLWKFLYLYKMKVQFSDNGEIINLKDYQPLNHNGDFKSWYSKFIVDYMRESAPMVGADSNHEYMLGYAQRAVISNNEDIRATSEEEFVSDLIENGHIKILET